MKKKSVKSSNAVFTTLGASNHTADEREINDFYATEPKAGKLLLENESFSQNIWEPACGMGHLARVFSDEGYNVLATDLIYRGYGSKQPLDFLNYDGPQYDGDIITNPPYKKCLPFAKKALETITDGRKVCLFLKLQFLESKGRKSFLEKNPPKRIYVSSSRLKCAKNGDFEHSSSSSAMCFAWFVWEKGFTGKPEISWIN